MGLKHGELKDMVLSKISLDEFEPKTGKIEDVIVIGFQTKEEIAGQDLYEFINSGSFTVNDVEVSPNPNPENYYMVFVEIPRNEGLLETLRGLVSDIENLTGKLKWRVTTHLTDDYFPLNSAELEKYVITNPNEYMDRKEFEAAQQEQHQMESQQKNESLKNRVLEFLKASSLNKADVNENTLFISGPIGSAELKIIGFGKTESIMKKLNIHESAIKDHDVGLRMFNRLLGEMKAESIGEYIVIYNPVNSESILITKPC